MGLVAAFLPVEVHAGVRAVPGACGWRLLVVLHATEAFLSCPCFKQGSIDREVLVGKQVALTRLLQSQLFNVRPSDPATMAAVVTFIAIVAFIACYLPASRATRVDPMVVLRDD